MKMLQDIEKTPAIGYKLLDIGPHWELHSSTGVYRGSLEMVRSYAVLRLGFLVEDIDIAVREMDKNFHDGAEFGIYKRFIFTFERSLYATSIIH
jgi:hypothetical protein